MLLPFFCCLPLCPDSGRRLGTYFRPFWSCPFRLLTISGNLARDVVPHGDATLCPTWEAKQRERYACLCRSGSIQPSPGKDYIMPSTPRILATAKGNKHFTATALCRRRCSGPYESACWQSPPPLHRRLGSTLTGLDGVGKCTKLGKSHLDSIGGSAVVDLSTDTRLSTRAARRCRPPLLRDRPC